MKKLTKLVYIIVLWGAISMGFAQSGLDPILIGNFENGLTNEGQGLRYDNWLSDFDEVDTVTGATLNAKALQLIDDDGGWGATFTKPLFEYGNTVESNPMLAALLTDDAVLSIDITAFPGGVAEDFASMALFTNAAAHWGDDGTTAQNLIIDGQPHTYVFPISDDVRTWVQDSLGQGWCNLGWLMNTGAGSTTIYVDNIWIFPDGPVNAYSPNSPSVDQAFQVDPDFVDATMHWKAAGAVDPADPNLDLPVEPDIVDQYIFMQEVGAADANLLYVGATGIDPGLVDPNSSYGPITLNSNSSYRWAVVEAINGYEQTFTPDVSTLADVDPNNIIGPTWNLQTLSAVPVIVTQPVSARFGVNDASVQFTIAVSSITTESYQWYFSTDGVIDAGDNPIASGITDTFTITSHNKAYQAYYYCKIWNQATVGGGGINPDVYSDVVSLVVERKVAEYLFDGNLNDTSTMALHGTGVGSPTFVTGVGGVGQALSLNGSTQYVEVANGFPRADLLAEDGIGGGLDIGSITCWVKLNATVADQVSPIMANGNGGWPHTEFKFEVPTDSTAANTNLRTIIWGDDEVLTMVDVNPVWADPFNLAGDNQWYMLVSAWNRNTGTMKAYLDGNLLATWGAAPSTFSAWENTMKIGFDGTYYFGGAIDNLKIYNYELTPEEIVDEYGAPGCIYDFAGSNHNSNQLGSSYCKIDLADFADLALNWLNDGFYTP